MSTLSGKHIILGISGGIAAYKSADLCRRLKDLGADVRVVMTDAAQAFITPLTLQAVSGNPVHRSLLDESAEAGMGHIELARWADLILIAPASADVMARLAQGIANDLLSALCLATTAPVALAPAMNQAMWKHPATQANRQRMEQYGYHFMGPGNGEQACGDVGVGRMLEPLELASLAASLLSPETALTDVHVVITAGPTREALDPVRYLSNHSSGKMGFALAAAAQALGAKTTLIAGPVNLTTPAGVNRIDVHSAIDMYEASMAIVPSCDIFIASAAVADYRPARVAEQKMKKHGETGLTLELVQNPDIIASIASSQPRPFTVGFAAETHDVEHYARRKLQRKNLDLVIANDVANPAIGFNSDNNAVTVISATESRTLGQMPKSQLARELLVLIANRYRASRH